MRDLKDYRRKKLNPCWLARLQVAVLVILCLALAVWCLWETFRKDGAWDHNMSQYEFRLQDGEKYSRLNHEIEIFDKGD